MRLVRLCIHERYLQKHGLGYTLNRSEFIRG